MLSPQVAPSAATPSGTPQISAAVARDADRYREAFLSADPFKHVVIENFFEPAFAERLLAEFPSFDPKLAMNEMGELGGKAVNPKIREISPSYKELYEAISAEPFLNLISRLSGIPDLILDPKMYGGGTHENRHGQDLDVHVDFNYDEAQQLHRRLNLIVYLNKHWQTEWGGAIEIHSDPRHPAQNRIHAYDPLFNRAVMFETNEYSWHGFPRINLPPEKRDLSRKSISIYLYTKTRPAKEIAPMHGTFYVQRPLPDRIQPGHALTSEDVNELRELIDRRDMWINFYHKAELSKNQEIASRDAMIRDFAHYARAPLAGYIAQEGAFSGIFPDLWVSSRADIAIQPRKPVSAIVLTGWRPEAAPAARVRVTANGIPSEIQTSGGMFEVVVHFPHPQREPFVVTIETESSGRAVDPGADQRDLQFRIQELRAQHPLLESLKNR